jgi:hypothetical protein
MGSARIKGGPANDPHIPKRQGLPQSTTQSEFQNQWLRTRREVGHVECEDETELTLIQQEETEATETGKFNR